MKEISVGKNLVANTKTTMYVIPNRHYAKWNLLFANNATSSAKAFSAWWYDKSENTEIIIFENYPLDAKGYLKLDGGAYIVLEEGDEIRVQIETGATASCLVTLELEHKQATRMNN